MGTLTLEESFSDGIFRINDDDDDDDNDNNGRDHNNNSRRDNINDIEKGKFSFSSSRRASSSSSSSLRYSNKVMDSLLMEDSEFKEYYGLSPEDVETEFRPWRSRKDQD